MSLRVITWNCRTALHKKAERLMSLRPDIAIIPECAEPDVLRSKAPDFKFSDCEWSGIKKSKGLGVFSFGGLSLRRHQSWERTHHLFIPVEVRGAVDINLLAVWAFNHRTPFKVTPNPKTTLAALEHYTPFLAGRPAIVAGDFNGNVLWDAAGKYERFATVDAKLQSLGLVSAYHQSTGSTHGAEPAGTLFFRGKADRPYHIDYIYFPQDMAVRVREMTIGSPDEWSDVSDHVPLVLDVEVDSPPS